VALKLSPTTVRRVATPLLRLLASTWRFEEVHPERRVSALASGGTVAVFWHEVLLPLVWYHRGKGYAVVISRSRDGRYIAELAASLGFRPIYGSSSRGAAQALLSAVREVRDGTPVAFTPDGPRGPRRRMKPGAIAAAQRAGAPVLAVHVEADRAWRLDSWDRFMLPRPWSRIRVHYAEPFRVPPGPEGLEQGVEAAGQALAGLAGAD
jgi:hypothetical protein